VKKTPLVLILGLFGAGLLSGLAARRMTQGSAVSGSKSIDVETQSIGAMKAPETGTSRADKPAWAPLPTPSSTDTAEILLAVDDVTLYPRLAAWLLGANKQDIAAYWNGYRTKTNRKTYIADLVFINWTRLNPTGAIAAVAGTKHDYFPWWAWSAHDPQAALAAAIATAPKMVDRVARGIGGFHPDWLRKHLDQVPEASRSSAFYSFMELDDSESPLESLKFMKENEMGFDPGTFKNLARKDPWEALEWLKQNPSLQARYYSNESPLDVLVEMMISDHPDDLERLVAQVPPGEMKRKMEVAMFKNLLATDPAAAITQAKATDSTVIAAERFVEIGLSLIQTNPDQAFEMAKELLKINPGGSSPSLRVEFPNGSSSRGGGDNRTGELLSGLIGKDPVRLMQMAIETATDASPGYAFTKVAYHWANQDLVSYTNWVIQQTDPAVRERAVPPVVNELATEGHYTEAIEWARSSEEIENSYLTSVFHRWAKADRAGAAGWLEASNLSAEKKSRLQETLKQISSGNDE
jgi:hypothetical protein